MLQIGIPFAYPLNSPFTALRSVEADASAKQGTLLNKGEDCGSTVLRWLMKEPIPSSLPTSFISMTRGLNV